MNIFVLSTDPVSAACQQNDPHVRKMVLETAQLLCAVHPPGTAPYGRTHYNHPSAKWTRASFANYEWLLMHGIALAAEYTRRYNKVHACEAIIEWCADNAYKLAFPEQDLTPFAQAMPVECKHEDPVLAYQTYYIMHKHQLGSWTPPASPPRWWPHPNLHKP